MTKVSNVKTNLAVSDLTKKVQEKNQEIARITKAFSEQIEQLKRENKKMQKQSIMMSVDDKYKQALRLYANGFGAGNIHRILTTEHGLDVTLEEVRMLIDKVDFLKPELKKYYDECKKEFGEQVKIDKGIFASTIYKKFQLLENTLTEQLEKARDIEDEKTVLMCVTELKNVYKEMSAVFFKGGFETTINNTVQDSMEAYTNNKKESTKILKFKGVESI